MKITQITFIESFSFYDFFMYYPYKLKLVLVISWKYPWSVNKENKEKILCPQIHNRKHELNCERPAWGRMKLQIAFQMWYDQGKWVTCRQCSILSFQYNLLVHLKSYIFIQTPLQSEIWFRRYEQIFKFLNNVKHKNLSPHLAYNSKSILATSDSFPLIMSQIGFWNTVLTFKYQMYNFYRLTDRIGISCY